MVTNFTPDIRTGTVNPPPVPIQELTADGAITIAAGVVILNKGSALAATLAAPPTGMPGARLTIIAKTAQAHTVTYTTGFNAGGSTLDVATFGGAIGDNMEIVAVNNTWYVVDLRNVTLG